jgi:hypothetical protein
MNVVNVVNPKPETILEKTHQPCHFLMAQDLLVGRPKFSASRLGSESPASTSVEPEKFREFTLKKIDFTR